MSDNDRPDPDGLLKKIQKAESVAAQGRLQIFLGMAPGVGKTYTMLEAAHRLNRAGCNVVVGVVETHGRPETEALVKNLEVVPQRTAEYRGTVLRELDLDAVLARSPEYVLIDELAHSNVPGSRHAKRYQDVLALLRAGIHVLTTINVQHVESRADIVKTITGVTVRETVPDSVVDLAEKIELVDLPEDDLLQRLRDGKVYLGEGRAQRATEHFFKRGNLTALREMALRLTAERVDQDLSNYMQENRIDGPWKSSERLMVAVGASPTSEQLIRWTRRTAYNLGAPWIAAYVETPRKLSPADQKLLAANLSLARELKGELVTAADVDVTRALLRIARQRNVTQIVVGKPVTGYFKQLLGDPSPVNRLIRESGDIDVYVVNGGKGQGPNLSYLLRSKVDSDLRQYGIALAVVASVSAISSWLAPLIGYWGLGLVMLLGTLVQALFTGRGPILLTAVLSALLWDYLFIPPRFTMQISRAEDLLLLAVYFVAALVMGTLTHRIRSRERAFEDREKRAVALYDFARELMSLKTVDEVAVKSVALLARVFDADVDLYVRDRTTTLRRLVPASGPASSEKEFGVALVAFESRAMAGWSTDTLSQAEAFYLPLVVSNQAVGVIGLRAKTKVLSVDQKSLLETLGYQAAIALERELLLDAASKTLVLEASERLHKSLLNSISHELRTPLAVIGGSVGQLLDGDAVADPKLRESLLVEISNGARRLNRLVSNLLDMSRLESGYLKARLEWIDLNDVVNAVLESLRWRAGDHAVTKHLAPSLPLAFADFVLLEQALKNLVHNALFHTAPGTRVEVSSAQEAQRLVIRVKDYGAGVSDADLPRLFEKFYRTSQAPSGGTGLGLSIARGFAEAQGGTVRAERHDEGGLVFTLSLPLKTMPAIAAEGGGRG